MTMPDRDRWKALSPLLDELLDLDASGRPARLAALRAEAPALASELTALMDAFHCAEAISFLGGSGRTVAWFRRRSEPS